LKTAAMLALTCADEEVRKSLASVLAPDNEGAPRSLSLSVGGKGHTLELDVKSASPSTAISTALALLRDVALFEEVWLLSRAKHGRVRRA
jgi:hypothetical protein